MAKTVIEHAGRSISIGTTHIVSHIEDPIPKRKRMVSILVADGLGREVKVVLPMVLAKKLADTLADIADDGIVREVMNG